ncbi:hypothetical protein KY285_036308 [Solanum tuberosum]|nr:hypothetical protein KY285_036308 [Solanum tuberosum]
MAEREHAQITPSGSSQNITSKSIIADLNKGEKLNGDNYDIWSRKIWDLEAYKAWKKANSTARGTIVSSVADDLIHECEKFPIAHAMRAHLRRMYGGTSVTRLRQLTIKFDTYKKRHDQNIKQHLRVMSNMIAQLKGAGHVLSDEQQVQAEHLKVNLTHNDSIKNFFDVAHHVELEDERIGAAKATSNAFVAESSGTK